MPIKKVLKNIQDQISELAPVMELFVLDSNQPSVEDCLKFQSRLNQLQEQLAVYKYHKLNNELSPSYNIHAHVSEYKTEVLQTTKEVVQDAEPVPEKAIEVDAVISEPIAEHTEPLVHKETVVAEYESVGPKSKDVVEEIKSQAVHSVNPSIEKHIAIGINDKFRFINTLFAQNSSEYHIAMEQLNSLASWHDTEIYLNSLKQVYNWQDDNEVVKYLYALAIKRFA
jgi:hypothetical protein